METKLVVIFFVVLTLVSCKKTETDPKNIQYSVGEGMEIYIANEYQYTGAFTDFANINFDSIELEAMPLIRYNDISCYDTFNHKLNLTISHDSLHFNDVGVNGGMFLVTLDKIPLYCGFKWRVNSSIPCQWVYIMEPYFELDGLAENQIQISFYPVNEVDPRNNAALFNRLKHDGKLNQCGQFD